MQGQVFEGRPFDFAQGRQGVPRFTIFFLDSGVDAYYKSCCGLFGRCEDV